MNDNIRRFPLPEMGAENTRPLDAVREAERMIESGEMDATGIVIYLVREDPENEEFDHTFLMAGPTMKSLSRLLGWIEVLKSFVLKEMVE